MQPADSLAFSRPDRVECRNQMTNVDSAPMMVSPLPVKSQSLRAAIGPQADRIGSIKILEHPGDDQCCSAQ